MITTTIEIHGETEATLRGVMAATGHDFEELLRRTLGLYMVAREADAAGKVVGIAATEDGPMETVFTGFRTPEREGETSCVNSSHPRSSPSP